MSVYFKGMEIEGAGRCRPTEVSVYSVSKVPIIIRCLGETWRLRYKEHTRIPLEIYARPEFAKYKHLLAVEGFK